MDRHSSHSFSSRPKCHHIGEMCEASYLFAVMLAQSIGKAHAVIGDDFSTSGFTEIKRCDRPCMVGWHCGKEKTYVFGSVNVTQDLDELVALVRHVLDPTQNTKLPSRPMEVPAFMLSLDTQDVLNKALAA